MSKYDKPEMVCIALTTFINEIRGQSAAIRAYDNVFQDNNTSNVFLKRAYESIWLELLSETARIFDKAYTGNNENCTFLRLRALCIKEQYSSLFPSGENDSLVRSLDEVLDLYSQLPIGKSRNKQLAHHDMKQIFEGECIAISLDQVEKLISTATEVLSKIYTRICFGFFDVSFPAYDLIV